MRRCNPGWTWSRFCEESGYDAGTPHRWFERYGSPVTRIHGRLPDSGNPESPNPLKEKAKSVEVFTVAEISREIESGGLSDNAVQKISVAIARAVDTGMAKPRVAAFAAIRIVLRHARVRLLCPGSDWWGSLGPSQPSGS
jgi:hypothetical protein